MHLPAPADPVSFPALFVADGAPTMALQPGAAAAALARAAADLPLSPYKLQIDAWHKWAGVIAFLLVLLRLVWRFCHLGEKMPGSHPIFVTLSVIAVEALKEWLDLLATPPRTATNGQLP